MNEEVLSYINLYDSIKFEPSNNFKLKAGDIFKLGYIYNEAEEYLKFHNPYSRDSNANPTIQIFNAKDKSLNQLKKLFFVFKIIRSSKFNVSAKRDLSWNL